ncbi:MAG: hypothetical protein A3F17_09165 [Gammaproteobacteria bacterium RIFCSPHIGHO2_12_FULL_41_15]|nr:MAG: hypothetical protein A3F17_09165 [Gammaproteobacteria bacterium RIFCSPHIGHO2_12_FULL_41_15]
MRFSNLKFYRRSFIIAGFSLLLIAVIAACFHHSTPSSEKAATSTALSIPSLNTTSAANQKAAELSTDWQTYMIKTGDSLASIFQQQHIPATTLEILLKNKLVSQYLTKIQPEQTLKLQIHNNQLLNLEYPFSINQTLSIRKIKDQFDTHIMTKPLTESTLYKSGTITHSLEIDARTSGLTTHMTNELEKIFSSEINFNHNLHTGDQFKILHEEYYLDGQKVKPGHILAAQFCIKHHLYSAFRYTSPEGITGYYDEDGHGVQPMLLRAPAHYIHISSLYSLHRWQPILHIWRPHLGIDYAAPANTPIHAAGDGYLSFIGKKNGYGNVIMIKHLNHYTTVYAHMSHFAKDMHIKTSVKKGETIGYVGMTGLATGPHVHFEIRHLGLRLNPLTTKLPGDNPIPWKDRNDFKQQEKLLAKQLQVLKDTGST